MNTILTIAKKELKSFFNSPIAYIFLCVFLISSSFLFFWDFFLRNQASMRGFFAWLPILFLFIIPAISMKMWSEEKKMGTIELLMTMPVKDSHVVLGKFLACFTFLAIAVFLTFPIVLTVNYLGAPDYGPIIGGYIGTLLMGAAYLAIGLFLSSITKNQIIAFIVSLAICFTLFIIGQPWITHLVPRTIAPLFNYIGIGTHFENIGRGVVDSRDIIYYFSIIIGFLYLNKLSVENRHWN
jgi:ABC-2 type transport system permease protein